MVTSHQNSNQTCTISHLLVLQLRDLVEGGKSQLLKFYRLFVRVYIEEKVTTLKVFFSNFYEILHNYSKDKKHDNCYFAILGEKCGF